MMKNKTRNQIINIFIIVGILWLIIRSNAEGLGEHLYKLVALYEKYLVSIEKGILDFLHSKVTSIDNFIMIIVVLVYALYINSVLIPKLKEIKNIDTWNTRLIEVVSGSKKLIKTLILAVTGQLLLIITLVYSYGVASTGTEINKLNGIALVNSTIAYIGGGSLKENGGGMALGYKVLAYIFLLSLMSKFVIKSLKSFYNNIIKKYINNKLFGV